MFRIDGEYSCLVTELLGPNLEQLFTFCEHQFTIPTTINIGLQVLSKLEKLHNKNFVHRVINPENMVIGQGRKSSQAYLIDLS